MDNIIDPDPLLRIHQDAASTSGGLWNKYREWARQHQHVLYLLDDTISRLLFWTPVNGNGSSRWRDMAWGILELHRLLLDQTVASRHLPEHAVATIQNDHNTEDSNQNQSIQWCLTVLQTLYPVLHQVVVGSCDAVTHQRQAKVRKYLETVRFVLRCVLLVRYWKSLRDSSIPPGLLLEGGRKTTSAPKDSAYWTTEREKQRVEQHNYVGARTGKRWAFGPPVATDWTARRRIQIGEFLYILRPLVQAHAPQQLLLPLVLDALSLLSTAQSSNPCTQSEWRRRRMRLWLYLLRSPIWDRYTEPAASAISRRVETNFLGRLGASYIWEWLHYWKEYRIEEG